ncbi:MAG: LysM peptidoglycan-binding domain-containing protein, partial [Bacteroidales bacterium]
GESMGKVAAKYHCTTKDLLTWNKLKSQNLMVGQKLRVNAPTKMVVEDELAKNTQAGEKQNGQASKFSSDAKYYVVKKGDYLSKVATDQGVTIDELVSWNSLETNNLMTGQKLRINPPDTGNNTKAANSEIAKKAVVDTTKADLKMVYYTVKSGDTLWSISQKYSGVTIDQLKEWNKLSGTAGLKVGQKLKVILPQG